MSRQIMLVALTILGATSMAVSAFGAELPFPEGANIRHRHYSPGCGPCGCLRATFVYHRDLLATYGSGFDPRNFDQTEPHFYPGRMHAYRRYWVRPVP